MRTSTVLYHKQRALNELNTIYSWLEISGVSSQTLGEKERAVFDSLKAKRCPRWLVEWLRGWVECRRRMAERNLVFFYVMEDGEMLSTHKNRPDYYEKMGVGPREVYEKSIFSGHYWCIKQHDGTERIVPYFVSSTRGEDSK